MITFEILKWIVCEVAELNSLPFYLVERQQKMWVCRHVYVDVAEDSHVVGSGY